MDKVLENQEQEEAKQDNQPVNRNALIDDINEEFKEVLYYYRDCRKDQGKEEAQKIIDRLSQLCPAGAKVIADNDSNASEDGDEEFDAAVCALSDQKLQELVPLMQILAKEGQELDKKISAINLKNVKMLPPDDENP